jgi:hypothetical protein
LESVLLVKKMIFGVAALLISLPSLAFTIDPNEYWAYSQPYHGGVRAFLSRQSCPIPKKGIEKEVQERYGIQEKSSQEKWNRSLQYIPQLPGTMPSCWIEIIKDKEPGVLVCIQRKEKLDTCIPIAKSYFLDTSGLPKAPSGANF